LKSCFQVFKTAFFPSAFHCIFPSIHIAFFLKSGTNKHRKTEENYQLIRKYLKENGLSKTTDIAQAIGLSPARTRAILKEMSGLEYEGTTNNRRYRLADDN
jgi:hypothetical protein